MNNLGKWIRSGGKKGMGVGSSRFKSRNYQVPAVEFVCPAVAVAVAGYVYFL